MATYRVIAWKGIPASGEAQDGADSATLELSERFQMLIDSVAMQRGLQGSDLLIAHQFARKISRRNGYFDRTVPTRFQGQTGGTERKAALIRSSSGTAGRPSTAALTRFFVARIAHPFRWRPRSMLRDARNDPETDRSPSARSPWKSHRRETSSRWTIQLPGPLGEGAPSRCTV